MWPGRPDTDRLTMVDMRKLLERQKEICLTVLLPTDRKKAETRQVSVRLSNLTGRAEKALSRWGLPIRTIERFVEPLRALADGAGFQVYKENGLALFRSEDSFERFRVPYVFEETVEAGPHFYVKPLLAPLVHDGEFYVLTLGERESRLLLGTRNAFETVDRPRILQGYGTVIDQSQARHELLEFFRRLDEGVRRYINGTGAPLVLAGVDRVRSIYRWASDYNNLVWDGVDGDPDEMEFSEIHREAHGIVFSLFEQRKDQAKALFRDLKQTGDSRAVLGLDPVIRAALNGRVQTLFVARDEKAWGNYESEREKLDLHEERREGDLDLLNLAVVHAVRNGSSVYPLPVERMPENALAAAILSG